MGKKKGGGGREREERKGKNKPQLWLMDHTVTARKAPFPNLTHTEKKKKKKKQANKTIAAAAGRTICSMETAAGSGRDHKSSHLPASFGLLRAAKGGSGWA